MVGALLFRSAVLVDVRIRVFPALEGKEAVCASGRPARGCIRGPAWRKSDETRVRTRATCSGGIRYMQWQTTFRSMLALPIALWGVALQAQEAPSAAPRPVVAIMDFTNGCPDRPRSVRAGPGGNRGTPAFRAPPKPGHRVGRAGTHPRGAFGRSASGSQVRWTLPPQRGLAGFWAPSASSSVSS